MLTCTVHRTRHLQMLVMNTLPLLSETCTHRKALSLILFIKGDRSEELRWSKNVQTAQIFLSAGFVCLFHRWFLCLFHQWFLRLLIPSVISLFAFSISDFFVCFFHQWFLRLFILSVLSSFAYSINDFFVYLFHHWFLCLLVPSVIS